jgi:hypothetical protein
MREKRTWLAYGAQTYAGCRTGSAQQTQGLVD